jgi:hypothetical protein
MESLIEVVGGIGFFLALFVIVAFHLFEFRNIRRQRQLCEYQAQKLGGQLTGVRFWYPTLVVPCCGDSATIKMRAALDNRSFTTASVNLSCVRTIQLSITQGYASYDRALSENNRRWNTGQDDFDGRFKIRTTDEQFTLHLLSSSLPHHMLRLASSFSGCQLIVTSRQLKIRIEQSLNDDMAYDTFLEIFFVCAMLVEGCTQIRTIRFDESPSKMLDNPRIVWNPDISMLEHPPFGLERLEINATAYSFHHVERFLTYSLNALGSKHLKDILEVVIIGKSSNIHPNLRNGFANLCHRVIETDHANNTKYS